MPKKGEIDYIANMARLLELPREQVMRSLNMKPYNAPRRAFYLIDIGQLFRFLPEPPARLLDLGCGSGWTSKMFACSGYEVLGIDLCPDMIEAATTESAPPNLKFAVHDYEDSLDFGQFDCAVIYDALHHAVSVDAVIRNVYGCLRKGGMFITAEPGAGHSTSPLTIEEAKRWGTTERDMPFTLQRDTMLKIGFREVRQYLRLSEVPLVSIDDKARLQSDNFAAVMYHTTKCGFTSIVVGTK
jgi:2-polyprenyl-3-methyl-5-hydroxy-6-metoxy-1,4-benzoquinol methylase